MSRMLKALQQLEARSLQPKQAAPSGSCEPPGTPPLPPPDDAPQGAVAVAPQHADSHDADPDDAAVEAILARVEIAAGATALQPDQLPADPHIVRWPVQAAEPQAQAFRGLAENILSQVPSGRPAALMFTSPNDLEGKAPLMVSLAAAIARQSRECVLLVDGNLYDPHLTRWLGSEATRGEATRGLAQVLMGAAAWHQVVRKTSLPRLDLLPGVMASSPGIQIPNHLNLQPLLNELRGSYRLVLIDTPSLVHADVAPMAGHCHGTYLVVQLGHTTRRNLSEAVQVIRDCRGHLLGSVVIAG